MTAQEARMEMMWRSLPPLIIEAIERTIKNAHMGSIPVVYFYKSVSPEAFKDIYTTIAMLELLDYQVDCKEVDVDDKNMPDIKKDTKLTIKW